MIRRSTCLALALAALVAGCHSSSTYISSKLDASAVPPVVRLFVYANVESTVFTGSIKSAFESTLRRRLRACEVKVKVLHHDDLVLDPGERLQQESKAFNPDVTLLLKANGGKVVKGQGGSNAMLAYQLGLFDSKTEQALWHASVTFDVLTKNPFVDDSASGSDFADTIVNRLRDDGVLKTCPKASN